MKKNSNLVSFPKAFAEKTIKKLEGEVERLKKENNKVAEMAARSILRALDLKDHYTFGHSTRVAFYSVLVGKELGLKGEELYNLELSALFHDIGKIGIPDHILTKPERLDPDEFEIMKKHPVMSYEILKDFENFKDIAKITRHHHERYDGRGYPDKLKGEDIPFFARIILVADTFDAMTSTRPYRKGLSYQVAFEELHQFSGSQFDPEIVKAFISALEKESRNGSSTFTLSIIDGEYLKDAA